MAEVEFLILANHVEAVNGLLYVSGGGWTDMTVPAPAEGQAAPPVSFGLGFAVLVPWTETNRPHRFIVRIEAEDGPEIVHVEGDVTAGRPAEATPGADLRAVMAINATIPLPEPGGYRAVVELVQGGPRSVSFRFRHLPPHGRALAQPPA